MIKKGVTLLSVLCILLVVSIITSFVLSNTAKESEQPDGLIVVSEVNFNKVTAMSITDEQSSLSLYIKDDQWFVSGSDNEMIDQIKASSISTHLCYVYANDIIEENATDLSKYGLSPAKASATITTKSGETHTFKYGFSTTDKRNVFMIKEGSNTVYSISNDHFDQLISNISDLQDLSIKKLDHPLNKIVFRGKNGIISFDKQAPGTYISSSAFAITQPVIAPVSPYVISTIDQTASKLRLNAFVGSELKDEYGINDESMWFSCVDDNGNAISIIFGADYDNNYRYCQVDGKDGYYTIGKQAFEFLNFPASEFLDSNMLTSKQGIIGFELSSKGSLASFKITDSGYMLNDNELSEQSATNTLSLLSFISISGLVDEQINSDPSYTLTLTLDAPPSAIAINLHEYKNSFYAVDFGYGPNIYVPASEVDAWIDSLS
jgi:hypothetical protein